MIRILSLIKISKLSAYLLTLVLVFSLSQLNAQDIKEKLRKDKRSIEKEIRYMNGLLEETKESKQSTLNELIIINRKISQRHDLLNKLSEEIVYLESRIKSTSAKIQELSDKLIILKEDYAEMIIYAYKNKSAYQRLMFVFSAEDFNQAYKRMKYLQQYSRSRKKQAQDIQRTQEEYNDQVDLLKSQKNDKEEAHARLRSEEIELLREKEAQNSSYSQLSNKEKSLKKELREKEKAARKLQKEIERIIAEEIRKANERANESTNKKDFALTPEEKRLSETFSSNKGKLPWPVERGIIISSFGEHAHPVLKGIKIKNNGIDLLTNRGSMARAVFQGEVSRILKVPNYKNVVIIRHGEFLSVYSNIDEVLVEHGQKVEVKQNIGLIYTDQQESKTELHFEIWKGKSLLNPAQWIAK